MWRAIPVLCRISKCAINSSLHASQSHLEKDLRNVRMSLCCRRGTWMQSQQKPWLRERKVSWPVSCEPPCSSHWLLGAQHPRRSWPGAWEFCSTQLQFLRDPISVSEGKCCKAGCSRLGLVLFLHAAQWGGVFSTALFSYQKNALNWILWIKTSFQCIHLQALFYTAPVERHGSLLALIWKLTLFWLKIEQSYLFKGTQVIFPRLQVPLSNTHEFESY